MVAKFVWKSSFWDGKHCSVAEKAIDSGPRSTSGMVVVLQTIAPKISLDTISCFFDTPCIVLWIKSRVKNVVIWCGVVWCGNGMEGTNQLM